MKYNIYFSFLLLALSFSFSEKIAVATKIKGGVERMVVGEKIFSVLKPGTILREEPQTKYTKKFLMMHIGIEKQKKEFINLKWKIN